MSGALPTIGLGGAGIGNLYRAVAPDAAEAAVHAALAAGYGLIDTAPYYGHGLSEMRIGAALKSWTGPKPLLSSKVGRVLDPAAPGEEGDFGFADPAPFRPRFDYSRDGVRRALEGSLSRLGVSRLDFALVHDIGAATHGDAHTGLLRQVLDETLPALEAARTEGLVGAIGLGVNEWQVCVEILGRARLDVILLAGRYTLLEQPALSSGLLDLCLVKKTKVLAAGVFNSGLLAAPPQVGSPYNYVAAPPIMIERARNLWDVCAAFGIAPQAAAVQFPARHPAIASIVLGARSPQEIAQQKAWLETSIPDALWDELKRRGFIAADAPLTRGAA